MSRASNFRGYPSLPKSIPDRSEIQRFYETLENPKDKALFLLYASSGLRRGEALSLHIEDINFQQYRIRPKLHSSKTKQAWTTFFNSEAAKVLKQYLENRKDNNPKLFPMAKAYERKLWHYARAKTNLDLTPQMLREWFCEEMGRLGVAERYIDAFCGRTKSVLARHCSDYSPEKLKAIYDKANLPVLGQPFLT